MSLGRFKITYSVQMLSKIHEELNEEPFSREKIKNVNSLPFRINKSQFIYLHGKLS